MGPAPNPRAHHHVSVLATDELVAAFGTADTRAIAKDVQRLGQRDLQARFRVVYKQPTFSNNNCWLRRKLLEAAGIQAPHKSSGSKARHGGSKRSAHSNKASWRPEKPRKPQAPKPNTVKRPSPPEGVRRTQRVPKLRVPTYVSDTEEGDESAAPTPSSAMAQRGSDFSAPRGDGTGAQAQLLWAPQGAQASLHNHLLPHASPHDHLLPDSLHNHLLLPDDGTQGNNSASASNTGPDTPERSSLGHSSSQNPLFDGEDAEKVAHMASKLLDEGFIFGSDTEDVEGSGAPGRGGGLRDSESLRSTATGCDLGPDSASPDWALLDVPEPLPLCFQAELAELQDALDPLVPASGGGAEAAPGPPLRHAISTPAAGEEAGPWQRALQGETRAWQRAVQATMQRSTGLAGAARASGGPLGGPPGGAPGGFPEGPLSSGHRGPEPDLLLQRAAPRELSGPAYRVYKQLRDDDGGGSWPEAAQKLAGTQLQPPPEQQQTRLLSLLDRARAREPPSLDPCLHIKRRSTVGIGAPPAGPESPPAATTAGLASAFSCPLAGFSPASAATADAAEPMGAPQPAASAAAARVVTVDSAPPAHAPLGGPGAQPCLVQGLAGGSAHGPLGAGGPQCRPQGVTAAHHELAQRLEAHRSGGARGPPRGPALALRMKPSTSLQNLLGHSCTRAPLQGGLHTWVESARHL